MMPSTVVMTPWRSGPGKHAHPLHPRDQDTLDGSAELKKQGKCRNAQINYIGIIACK